MLEVDIIRVPVFPGDLTDPPIVIVEGIHYLVHIEKGGLHLQRLRPDLCEGNVFTPAAAARYSNSADSMASIFSSFEAESTASISSIFAARNSLGEIHEEYDDEEIEHSELLQRAEEDEAAHIS
nr:hypothetical protein Iba_chr12aCG14660 [Ipomoea batatas]